MDCPEMILFIASQTSESRWRRRFHGVNLQTQYSFEWSIILASSIIPFVGHIFSTSQMKDKGIPLREWVYQLFYNVLNIFKWRSRMRNCYLKWNLFYHNKRRELVSLSGGFIWVWCTFIYLYFFKLQMLCFVYVILRSGVKTLFWLTVKRILWLFWQGLCERLFWRCIITCIWRVSVNMCSSALLALHR